MAPKRRHRSELALEGILSLTHSGPADGALCGRIRNQAAIPSKVLQSPLWVYLRMGLRFIRSEKSTVPVCFQFTLFMPTCLIPASRFITSPSDIYEETVYLGEMPLGRKIAVVYDRWRAEEYVTNSSACAVFTSARV